MENLGLFEKYHDGSFTDSEKTDFLRRLDEDNKFAQEFKIYNEVNNYILKDDKRSEFISTLNKPAQYKMNTKESATITYNNNYTIYSDYIISEN